MGYTRIMQNCLANARHLSDLLEQSGLFTLINRAQILPIVALRLKDESQGYSVFDLSDKLRARGWVIAAYTMPPNAEEVAVMRVVVREHFSCDMAEILARDIFHACEQLKTHGDTRPVIETKHRPIC